MNTAERGALEHENWIAYLTGVVRCTGAAHVQRDRRAVTILTDEIGLNGIVRILNPLMPRFVRRQYGANLGRLKAILEAQPAKGA